MTDEFDFDDQEYHDGYIYPNDPVHPDCEESFRGLTTMIIANWESGWLPDDEYYPTQHEFIRQALHCYPGQKCEVGLEGFEEFLEEFPAAKEIFVLK